MSWQRDPFSNIADTIRAAADGLLELQKQQLADTQQQLESLLKAAAHHGTLKMPTNVLDETQAAKKRAELLSEAEKACPGKV